jgi:hypothetical protein
VVRYRRSYNTDEWGIFDIWDTVFVETNIYVDLSNAEVDLSEEKIVCSPWVEEEKYDALEP